MSLPNTPYDDPLRVLRTNSPDALEAARGIVFWCVVGSCVWTLAVFIYATWS